MPNRCVVGRCSRVSTDEVSLYFWPRDEAQAKLWDRFVRCYRRDWRGGKAGKSVVCSYHFEDKWFDPSQLMQKQLGFRKRALDLLPGATPTIYSKENCSATAPDTWGSPPLKKRRGAFEKRQHQRILDDIFPESEVPDQTVPDVQLQSQTPLSSLTAINLVYQCEIEIEAVVTDRHKQIAKWLREEKGNVTHYTDIWHCAKGNRKKWEAAAKLKGCTEIGPWIRSATNHLYWCTVSTPGLDEASKAMRKAKWLSISNHMVNQHTGHGEPFTKCAHRRLRRADRKKAWIDP
ncbi:hypothetical protein CAPTEDRAFT_185718, partial [Capitella teleta]